MKRKSVQLHLKPLISGSRYFYTQKSNRIHLRKPSTFSTRTRETSLEMTSFYLKGGNLKEVTTESYSPINCFEKKQKETMAHKEKNTSQPMNDHQFYVLMLTVFVILMGFWISKNEGRIYHWIYVHFVQIAMTLYFASIAGLYFLREKMKKNLRSDRLFHLSKVWNDEDGVFVGTTTDNTPIHLPRQNENWSRSNHRCHRQRKNRKPDSSHDGP